MNTKTIMSFLTTLILLFAFIASVLGQITLGPFQLRFAIPLRIGGNGAASTVSLNGVTPTSISLQNNIRTQACSISNHEACPHGGTNQQSCEAAGCCWHVHSVSRYGVYGSGQFCYKYGDSNQVTNSLLRQYRFNLPGYSTYQQKYNAVKQYVDCTLSKPKGTYINGVQDCQANTYAPSNHQPTYHQPAANHHQVINHQPPVNHQHVVNHQHPVNHQHQVSHQPAINHQPAVNYQQANNYNQQREYSNRFIRNYLLLKYFRNYLNTSSTTS